MPTAHQSLCAEFAKAQFNQANVSGTYTVPAGATMLIIELWGGGGGGNGTFGTAAGGGAGGYCRSIYPCVGGQTLTLSGTGSRGNGSSTNTGSNGLNAVVSSGTLSITTMTAGGGQGGQPAAGGAGGTATGGNDANIPGQPGSWSASANGGDWNHTGYQVPFFGGTPVNNSGGQGIAGGTGLAGFNGGVIITAL